MPYLAKLEKAGIPTVLVDLEDQRHMVKEWALMMGVPHIRFLHASRTLRGPEDVEIWIEPMLEALTRTLTEEEKEPGRWEPPQQRILFEGALEEAEDFYQQTQYIPSPVNAPISIYTDGLPIRVPTEERVQEMLTGTSHKPDELITLQSDRKTATGVVLKKGTIVPFQPSIWRTATVEKVATIAVMAGCKPEQLPVVLAIAESGCGTSTTNNSGQWVVVSGPITKEIGMNSGCGFLNPGNPANMSIGRTYQLMSINLGGAIPGVSRMASQGNPINTGGTCFSEDLDGLPPGWNGLNEESGFKKNESVVMVMNTGAYGATVTGRFTPGGYRALQKSGHGGMARRLGVKGIPGPHNWLEYILPELPTTREGAVTLVMVPEMAQHLYEYGFKSKEEIYKWLWERSFISIKDYKLRSRPDFATNGWMGIEKTSGKPWKELPDDYMIPPADDPSSYCIIIGGGEEERYCEFDGRGGEASNPIYNVDAWR
ncbi:hypothetical protein ACFLVZ_00920 [Chloroflexota bacterium]